MVSDNSKGGGKNGCGAEDLETSQAQVTLANAGGFVADETGTFSAHMRRHDLEGRQLLLGDASGVDNTSRRRSTRSCVATVRQKWIQRISRLKRARLKPSGTSPRSLTRQAARIRVWWSSLLQAHPGSAEPAVNG